MQYLCPITAHSVYVNLSPIQEDSECEQNLQCLFKTSVTILLHHLNLIVGIFISIFVKLEVLYLLTLLTCGDHLVANYCSRVQSTFGNKWCLHQTDSRSAHIKTACGKCPIRLQQTLSCDKGLFSMRGLWRHEWVPFWKVLCKHYCPPLPPLQL